MLGYLRPTVYAQLDPDRLSVRDVRSGRSYAARPVGAVLTGPVRRVVRIGDDVLTASASRPLRRVSVLARTALLALLLAGGAALAQQDEPANGVLLVAKPELDDPNFGRSVVLVTQTRDGETLGVILNKPTPAGHAGRPLWFGGPVMSGSVVALFAADAAPAAAAFHVLRNVYLSMHPANLTALLGARGARFRLYSGFAAWAPGQLEREFGRDAWLVVPADEALLFRDDMTGLWDELIAKAAAPKT